MASKERLVNTFGAPVFLSLINIPTRPACSGRPHTGIEYAYYAVRYGTYGATIPRMGARVRKVGKACEAANPAVPGIQGGTFDTVSSSHLLLFFQVVKLNCWSFVVCTCSPRAPPPLCPSCPAFWFSLHRKPSNSAYVFRSTSPHIFIFRFFDQLDVFHL
jgi:hypothetical protein